MSQDLQANFEEPEHVPSDNYFLDETYFSSSVETQQALSPTDAWRPENMSTLSLVIGNSEQVKALQELLEKLLLSHEVQTTTIDDAFELCNERTFQLLWLFMSVPVSQDLVSLTTSIRYSSKSNRGTVIIGVADADPDVDLRMHGIDEVVTGRVTDCDIRQKYAKWTSVQVTAEEPATPSLPEEICSADPSSPTSEDPEKSVLNFSVDSGIEFTPSSISTPNPEPTKHDVDAVEQPAALLKLNSLNTHVNVTLNPRVYDTIPTDHTTKEKLRRERIKESCDQLRVMLPYIRGRKTDMASILEMCVDYLKIVNAALPEEFQNEVVDVLSRESEEAQPPPPPKKEKKPTPPPRTRKPSHPTHPQSVRSRGSLDVITSTAQHLSPIAELYKVAAANSIHTSIATPVVSSTPKPTPHLTLPQGRQLPHHQPLFKRGYGDFMEPSKVPKRPHHPDDGQFNLNDMGIGNHMLQPETSTGMPYGYGSQTLQLPQFQVYPTMDPFMDRVCTPMQMDPLSQSAADFYSSQMPLKSSVVDRDPYTVFMDSSSHYSFYGGLPSSSVARGGTKVHPSVTDYVNPNVVLPVYNGPPRTSPKTEDTEKSEDQSKLSE